MTDHTSICFICSEAFLGKRKGGFGRLVRILGRELAKKGFDVHVICWRELSNEDYPHIVDGIHIWTYRYNYASKSLIEHLCNYIEAKRVIERIAADVWVSIDCMVETLIAMKLFPRAKHVIYLQDPRSLEDLARISSVDPLGHWKPTLTDVLRYKVLNRSLYSIAIRKANVVFVQARYQKYKVHKLYGVPYNRIVWLPNPVEIPPNHSIVKDNEPVALFLGRLDPEKRFWKIGRIAKAFPHVHFVIAGRPSDIYESWSYSIVRKLLKLPNVKYVGFVEGSAKEELLSRSWILVLPSIYEGLPLAFLEALAHKCALLSSVNPDNLTSLFGYHAAKDDFEAGLQWLLVNDMWKELGERGYCYIQGLHSLDKVLNLFIHYITA